MRFVVIAGFAALSGYLAYLAVKDVRPHAHRYAESLRLIFVPLLMAERGGYVPSRSEERSMALAGGALGASLGWAVFGSAASAVLGPLGAVAAWRLPAVRRARYTREVERGLPQAAHAIADSLAAGRSLRGTLVTLPGHVNGPVSAEFRSLAAELELGRPMNEAISGLAERVGSSATTSLAAALIAGATSGGDLVGLLRRLGAATELRQRSVAEARSATSQARLTAAMVAGMPVAGAALVELLRPGTAVGILASPLALILVLAAILLQAGGFALIRRLATAGER